MARKRTNTHTDGMVGARIRRARVQLDLSQRDLECDGVTYAYISRIEAGLRTPSISALVRIAARLHEQGAHPMSALYLLTGEHDGPCLVCGRQEPTNGGSSNGNRGN